MDNMVNKKKITFVINSFSPDLSATSQILTELTRELQDDFDITVIAAQVPNASVGVNDTRIFEEGSLGNIKVIRLRLPNLDKNSKISRVKNIVSYFLLANIALLREKETDVIFTISQPPIVGGLIGSLGKFFKRTKHIYNIHDFNPEQAAAVAYTKNGLILNVAKWIDNLNCRYADHILLLGEDMGETLSKRFHGKNVPSYSVISNWTDEKEIIPLDKTHSAVAEFLSEHNLEDKFIVMYSGNLGLYYDLENIIQVAKEFERDPSIVFLFIGDGAVKNKMQEYVSKEDLKNVLFLPFQPKDFIRYSLNAADVHLVVNQKGIKGVSVPSKIYGVMAAGKPVLGVLEQGSEVDRLISESDCGVRVEPQDYAGIARSIELLRHMDKERLKEMGLNGRTYLEKHLTKATSVNNYRDILNSISEKDEPKQLQAQKADK
jgi:colanic acid biosynthesis glycosyl transferase WcaI